MSEKDNTTEMYAILILHFGKYEDLNPQTYNHATPKPVRQGSPSA